MIDSADLDELQEEMARAVRAADQSLDEVARMRMQGRILASAGAPPRLQGARRRQRLAIALSLLLIPSAAAILAFKAGHLATKVAMSDGALGAAQQRPLTHLEVPAGAKIRSTLGGRVRITLVGPAELGVLSTSAELVEIRLSVGVLVGEYDHERGGTLRVHSPQATTEVVGTLFAIEATSAGSRVSVARGQVHVRDADAHQLVVVGGESWSSERRAVGRMDPEVPRLFDLAAEGIEASSAQTVAPVEKKIEVAQSSGAMAARAQRPAHPRSRSVARIESMGSSSPGKGLRSSPVSASPRPEVPMGDGSPVETATAKATTAKATGIAQSSLVARPRESSEALYARAETRMRDGDLPGARQDLELLVRTGSGAATVAARYELARLAVRAGDLDGAAATLDELLASDRETSLREPARFLRCRIERERGNVSQATACLKLFLQDFPRSAHADAAQHLLDGGR